MDLTDFVNEGSPRKGDSLRMWRDHYDALRGIAAGMMQHERQQHSLQPTALVHEALLRMVDRQRVSTEGTTFFKSCFATECRRILVDEARKRLAKKRGGGANRQSLSGLQTPLGVDQIDLLDLNEAIEALGKMNERLVAVVDMRIFGGLTVAQCARELDVSMSTVDNDWAFARAWLRRKMSDTRGSDAGKAQP